MNTVAGRIAMLVLAIAAVTAGTILWGAASAVGVVFALGYILWLAGTGAVARDANRRVTRPQRGPSGAIRYPPSISGGLPGMRSDLYDYRRRQRCKHPAAGLRKVKQLPKYGGGLLGWVCTACDEGLDAEAGRAIKASVHRARAERDWAEVQARGLVERIVPWAEVQEDQIRQAMSVPGPQLIPQPQPCRFCSASYYPLLVPDRPGPVGWAVAHDPQCGR